MGNVDFRSQKTRGNCKSTPCPSSPHIYGAHENAAGLAEDATMRKCVRTNLRRREANEKIISFSLWGNHPVYVAGALRNAELAAEIYPGWTCRFYLGRDVSHELAQKLGAFPHVETVAISESPGWRGMFWRFYPAAESDVEVLLVRDVDCRLGRREAAAVLEWLGSPLGFHIMRDHPLHRTEILGGMWGVKGGVLTELRKQIRRYKPRKVSGRSTRTS